MKRAFEPSCRIPSKRLSWQIALVESVSVGVCHEACTKLWAAMWTI